MTEPLIDVPTFDRLSELGAGALLEPVCGALVWVVAMVATRPHGTWELLTTRSDEAIAAMEWSDVRQALDAHPRIGDRPSGDSPESSWSREEQAGAAGSAEELRAANVAYEQRFDHVFLICATGKSSEQILAAARDRLDHDDETERRVVRDELAAIVRLRLARVLS